MPLTARALPDSPLAIRLRSDVAIDPASSWGPLPGYAEDEATVEWQPVREGDLRDVWVIFRPTETWYIEDVLALTVGAQTVTGEPVSEPAYPLNTEPNRGGLIIVGRNHAVVGGPSKLTISGSMRPALRMRCRKTAS